MHPDHRKEKRSSSPRQPKGKLQLIVGAQRHHVIAVKDISPTGVRLEIGIAVAIGTPILVRYFDDKVDLQLNGIVVWNSASEPGAQGLAQPDACIIGIKLAGPSLLEAYL
ncbi:MAG TPA: PilZ domain-containing protein [Sideroxyarcus sp.]|nr:PilZ domain-containing protein [Sideroxyarcus sp.]